MALLNTVRAHRQAAGISARELGRRATLDIHQLIRIERNEGGCSDEAKVRIAKALGASVEALFFAEAVA